MSKGAEEWNIFLLDQAHLSELNLECTVAHLAASWVWVKNLTWEIGSKT